MLFISFGIIVEAYELARSDKILTTLMQMISLITTIAPFRLISRLGATILSFVSGIQCVYSPYTLIRYNSKIAAREIRIDIEDELSRLTKTIFDLKLIFQEKRRSLSNAKASRVVPSKWIQSLFGLKQTEVEKDFIRLKRRIINNQRELSRTFVEYQEYLRNKRDYLRTNSGSYWVALNRANGFIFALLGAYRAFQSLVNLLLPHKLPAPSLGVELPSSSLPHALCWSYLPPLLLPSVLLLSSARAFGVYIGSALGYLFEKQLIDFVDNGVLVGVCAGGLGMLLCAWAGGNAAGSDSVFIAGIAAAAAGVVRNKIRNCRRNSTCNL